jgi:hypothetical protein
MRGSESIEEDVRWPIFRETVREARAAFAEVSPKDLQKASDEAIEEVRARNQGIPSVNYNR